MADQPKRGRPKGTVLSDETKARISASKRGRGQGLGIIPPADDLTLTIKDRETICERARWLCGSCKTPYTGNNRGASHYEKYVNFRIISLSEGERLVCGYCRRQINPKARS